VSVLDLRRGRMSRSRARSGHSEVEDGMAIREGMFLQCERAATLSKNAGVNSYIRRKRMLLPILRRRVRQPKGP